MFKSGKTPDYHMSTCFFSYLKINFGFFLKNQDSYVYFMFKLKIPSSPLIEWRIKYATVKLVFWIMIGFIYINIILIFCFLNSRSTFIDKADIWYCLNLKQKMNTLVPIPIIESVNHFPGKNCKHSTHAVNWKVRLTSEEFALN